MKSTLNLFLLFLPLLLISQNTTFSNTNHLNFKNSTEERIVKINVTEDIFQIDIRIHSMVQQGELSLEIYKPINSSADSSLPGIIRKEMLGEFSIGGSEAIVTDNESNTKENVVSELNKILSDPSPGLYIVKFTSKKASGDVNISIVQYSK
ncbi:hypothetical protein [Winogradskyella sp. PE311]|uniref:hypothetical protein n=1 Tax=Winogradskyella sp. PE311 TaxID=3366943 RepID=UPI0039817329